MRIDTMLTEMFQMQKQLNTATAGKDWNQGFTDKGKKINWNRCIYMEVAEIIDSLPWKHWKSLDSKIDMDNIKVELVDIWHFLMSEILKQPGSVSPSDFIFIEVNKTATIIDYTTRDTPFSPTEDTIARYCDKLINEATNISPKTIVMRSIFFELCSSVGFSIEDLYRLYIGKNVLNQFRQDNGYKEDTYKKIWGKHEDNVVMQKLVTQFNISEIKTSLYGKLLSEYKKVS